MQIFYFLKMSGFKHFTGKKAWLCIQFLFQTSSVAKKFLEHLAPVLSLVGNCRLPTLQKFIINGVSEIWIQCVDVTKYITSFHKLHRELLCLSYKSSLNSTKIWINSQEVKKIRVSGIWPWWDWNWLSNNTTNLAPGIPHFPLSLIFSLNFLPQVLLLL